MVANRGQLSMARMGRLSYALYTRNLHIVYRMSFEI